jgi:DNA polymerase III delta subunit
MLKALEFLGRPVAAGARLFVVAGEETWLRSQVVRRIREHLGEDVELQVVLGAGADGVAASSLTDLLDEVRTASLFGAERLIHLKDADAFVKEHEAPLSRFLQSGELAQVLLVEGEKLLPKKTAKQAPSRGFAGAAARAGGVLVRCDPLYDAPFGGRGPAWDSPLTHWLVGRARERGKELPAEVAYALHRMAGTALGTLDSELDKLALYVGERRRITGEDVERVVGAGRLAPVFELADHVALRDLGAALEQSGLLFGRGVPDARGRPNRDPVAIANILQRTVASKLHRIGRLTELIGSGQAFDDAASALKLPPWGRERVRAQADALRHPEDRRRLRGALLDLERALKGGGGAPRVLFDVFLVRGIGADAGRGRAWRR